VTLTIDRRTQLLGACPLFGGVSPDDLLAIGDRAIEVDVPAEHVIARQGEIGTGFFVVIEGRVRVVRDGEVVTTLGPGEFFGELSVLDRMPRNAMVAAEVPTTCLALASWDFEAVIRDEPAVALAVLRVLAGRLRELTEAARH
jgi:CRP/FNR family cyclic AMP-dependent transcriptional regulator